MGQASVGSSDSAASRMMSALGLALDECVRKQRPHAGTRSLKRAPANSRLWAISRAYSCLWVRQALWSMWWASNNPTIVCLVRFLTRPAPGNVCVLLAICTPNSSPQIILNSATAWSVSLTDPRGGQPLRASATRLTASSESRSPSVTLQWPSSNTSCM
ncbi:TPA_asm: UL8.4 [Human alphaherpesvirus 1]|nr:TPA_asm: UL8.4 [Human alphaherpesvirus 1]